MTIRKQGLLAFALAISFCLSANATDRERRTGGAALVDMPAHELVREIESRMRRFERDGVSLVRVAASTPASTCFALRYTAIDAGISPPPIVVQIEPSLLGADRRSLVFYFAPNGGFNSREASKYVEAVETWISDFRERGGKPVGEGNKWRIVKWQTPTLAAKIRKSSGTKESVALMTAALAQTFGETPESASSGERDETATIEIRTIVTELKRPSRGQRFWTGAAAGSSKVRVNVTFHDAKSGTTLGQKDFQQDHRTHPQGWTSGEADQIIFLRLADRIDAYLEELHDQISSGAERTGG